MSKRKVLFSSDSIEEIRQKKEKWQEKTPSVEKAGQGMFKTLSGLPVKRLYSPEDIPQLDYLQDMGFPGEEPFVRGVHPTMYRGRTWTLRQLAGFGPPEETNRRYRLLLKEGATGINGVFDYPTLRGYDSTDPIARADAGRHRCVARPCRTPALSGVGHPGTPAGPLGVTRRTAVDGRLPARSINPALGPCHFAARSRGAGLPRVDSMVSREVELL